LLELFDTQLPKPYRKKLSFSIGLIEELIPKFNWYAKGNCSLSSAWMKI